MLGLKELVPGFTLASHRLAADERLVLLSAGVTERRLPDGARFGLEGVARALGDRERPAGALVAQILDGLFRASPDPPDDDASVLVLAPTSGRLHALARG